MIQIVIAGLVFAAGLVLFIQSLRFKLGKSRWLGKLNWMLLLPGNQQTRPDTLCFLLLLYALCMMLGSLFWLILRTHN